MKIGKEIWLVVAVVAFLIAYLIDVIAGPVTIVIGAPIAFLESSQLLHTYPFTATAIIIRSFAIFVSTMLIVTSIMNRKYFTKAAVLFFIGLLGEFYAVQQLTTGSHLTTIQWTLSIAYGSLALTIGIIGMILMGIWGTFNQKEEPTPKVEDSEEEKSVLEP